MVVSSDEEGFGLTPVEALACGTPVTACDVPALREVLGRRATFVGLSDIGGLVAAAESAIRPLSPCCNRSCAEELKDGADTVNLLPSVLAAD